MDDIEIGGPFFGGEELDLICSNFGGSKQIFLILAGELLLLLLSSIDIEFCDPDFDILDPTEFLEANLLMLFLIDGYFIAILYTFFCLGLVEFKNDVLSSKK